MVGRSSNKLGPKVGACSKELYLILALHVISTVKLLNLKRYVGFIINDYHSVYMTISDITFNKLRLVWHGVILKKIPLLIPTT